MTKEKAIKTTNTLCKVCTIVGIVFLLLAFYKNTFYNNPLGDDYKYNDDEMQHNVYVGGDAYNYIINGTRFTAYAVMGTGSLIIASIMGVFNVYLTLDDKKEIPLLNQDTQV